MLVNISRRERQGARPRKRGEETAWISETVPSPGIIVTF